MKKPVKKCLGNTILYLEDKLKKATSYEVVKTRLNYRLYSPDLLDDREKYFEEKKESI